jgi:hypothetical protein
VEFSLGGASSINWKATPPYNSLALEIIIHKKLYDGTASATNASLLLKMQTVDFINPAN